MPSKRWMAVILMTLMAGGSAVADVYEIDGKPITADDVAVSLDTVWMILGAMLVFFMQP